MSSAFRNENNASIVMPMSRNGNESNQTMGYSTSASSANGQQKINSSNHRRNFTMGHLHFSIRTASRPVAEHP